MITCPSCGVIQGVDFDPSNHWPMCERRGMHPKAPAQLPEEFHTLGGLGHSDHPWMQVGRCVYCGPCGVRLYQGRMPDDHEIYRPPYKLTPADKMRLLWRK